MTKAEQMSFGSYSPSDGNVFLIFCRTASFWNRYIPGFNHVILVKKAHDYHHAFLWVEPLIWIANICLFHSEKDIPVKKGDVVVQLNIDYTFENRLLRPILQTCATLVQYLVGISLGCMFVQSLYNKLTTSSKEYLLKKGIKGVKVWAVKPEEH